MSKVSLIITIVKKGWGDKVLEASIKAGAGGATVLMGRGVGIHEKQTILGIPIEPEKEIVLSVIDSAKSEEILDACVEACKLEEPGAGIAFVVPVEKVVGIAHLMGEGDEGSVE